MATRIQIRRDTSIAWAANNPVLALGEPGLETDTFIIKYGDGSSAWNDLPYANVDSLADFTTTDLAEGNNLYYSNARVYANVVQFGFVSNSYLNSVSFATNAQVSSYATNAQLTLYASNAQIAIKANIADLTTSNVVEGSNLYYSNSRVGAYISSYTDVHEFNTPLKVARYTYDQMGALVAQQGQVIYETSNNIFRVYDGTIWTATTKTTDLTTANVSEVSNLYYSNARVYENVLSMAHATNAQINALTTNTISESGNLYFTNARVTSALTSTTANITLGNVLRVVNYTYDEMQALTGAQKGWIIFETSNNVFRGYNGTSWSNLG